MSFKQEYDTPEPPAGAKTKFFIFNKNKTMDSTVGMGTPNKTVINMPETGGFGAAEMALLSGQNKGGMESRWPLLLLMGGRGGLGGWGNGGAAAGAIATDITLNPAFQSLQNQISTLSGQVNNNNVLDQITDGNSQILAGITSVNQNISGTSRDI